MYRRREICRFVHGGSVDSDGDSFCSMCSHGTKSLLFPINRVLMWKCQECWRLQRLDVSPRHWVAATVWGCLRQEISRRGVPAALMSCSLRRHCTVWRIILVKLDSSSPQARNSEPLPPRLVDERSVLQTNVQTIGRPQQEEAYREEECAVRPQQQVERDVRQLSDGAQHHTQHPFKSQ